MEPQVVYKLESKTQRKMRSKGLQKEKESDPEADASAESWVLFQQHLEAQTP